MTVLTYSYLTWQYLFTSHHQHNYLLCFISYLATCFDLQVVIKIRKVKLTSCFVGPVAQSVQRLTTGWTVRDRIPVGTRFSVRPDRPWGPPSPLYNGYRVFPGGRGGRGVGLNPPTPIQCRKVLEKSTAIPLLTLRGCVACKKGETYPFHVLTVIFSSKIKYTCHFNFIYYNGLKMTT